MKAWSSWATSTTKQINRTDLLIFLERDLGLNKDDASFFSGILLSPRHTETESARISRNETFSKFEPHSGRIVTKNFLPGRCFECCTNATRKSAEWLSNTVGATKNSKNAARIPRMYLECTWNVTRMPKQYQEYGRTDRV